MQAYTSVQEQELHLLDIFSSLFAKEQLRKNIYIFKNLNPNMTLKFRVIANERHVAGVTKDPNIIQSALKNCSLVEVNENSETIRILIDGDPLALLIKSKKQAMNADELRKKIHPLLKDIRHEIKGNQQKNRKFLKVQFQSEAAVSEFVARFQAKQDLSLALSYQIKEKDPYDCLKESIKLLKKQRRTQQQQAPTYTNYSPQGYYNNQSYESAYKMPRPGDYHPFIRRAVQSSDEQEHQKQQKNTQNQQNGTKPSKIDSQEFPVL